VGPGHRAAAQISTAAVVTAVVSVGTGSLLVGLESGILAVDLGEPLVRQLR
jgi:hypothetical protein